MSDKVGLLETPADHARLRDIIAEDDHEQLVEQFLSKGLDLYIQLCKPRMPVNIGVISILEYAIESGSLQCVEALLAHGADPNFGGRCGHVPLIFACRQPGDCGLVMVTLLLEKGAKVNMKYMSGNTALLEAVSLDDTAKVKLLIEAGSNVWEVNNGGDTALHMASLKGNVEIVKMFIAAGVDVNLRQAMGPSIRSRHIMRQLEQRRAAEDCKDPNFKSFIKNSGICPLHFTTYGPYGGHFEVAKVLIEHGADVDACMENGRTALHLAALRNAYRVAALLIQHGCKIDVVSEENQEHKTPLLKAVDGKHVDMVRMLVQAGADINFGDVWGLTPLITAIFSGSPLIVKVLLQLGSDMEIPCKNGISPLVAALRKDKPIYVKLLIAAGCKLPSCNKDGIVLLEDVDVFDNPHYYIQRDSFVRERIWFQQQLDNPRHLNALCRAVIRDATSRKQERIRMLPVPSAICAFLCLEDLNDIVTESDGNM